LAGSNWLTAGLKLNSWTILQPVPDTAMCCFWGRKDSLNLG